MKLTPLEPEDLELLYTIENDPTLWSVGSANVPYSRHTLCEYLTSQQSDIYADRQLRLVIRVDDTETLPSHDASSKSPQRYGKAVGLVDLFNFSPANLRAELGIAILKEEQGRGYGRQAVRLLLDYARRVLHINMVYAVVPEDNIACLAMLRTEGFDNEHRLAQWLRRSDGWCDAVVLQRLLH